MEDEKQLGIYKKLREFQKLGIKVEKDATNPHYRSSYSSLNEVLDKVMAPLNQLCLVVVQKPEAEGLRTILIDAETGETMQGFIPYIGATDMQKLGGAISYARRYSLIAMLGLEAEDDDGNTASKPTQKVGNTNVDYPQNDNGDLPF